MLSQIIFFYNLLFIIYFITKKNSTFKNNTEAEVTAAKIHEDARQWFEVEVHQSDRNGIRATSVLCKGKKKWLPDTLKCNIGVSGLVVRM